MPLIADRRKAIVALASMSSWTKTDRTHSFGGDMGVGFSMRGTTTIPVHLQKLLLMVGLISYRRRARKMPDEDLGPIPFWPPYQSLDLGANKPSESEHLSRELTRLRSWLGHIGASTQDADVLGDTVRALRGDDPPVTEGDDTGETTRAA